MNRLFKRNFFRFENWNKNFLLIIVENQDQAEFIYSRKNIERTEVRERTLENRCANVCTKRELLSSNTNTDTRRRLYQMRMIGEPRKRRAAFAQTVK